MRKNLLLVLFLCLTIILAACGDDQGENTESNPEGQKDNGNSEEATTSVDDIVKSVQVDEDSVVAKVNGEEINGSEYNVMIGQIVSTLQQYGQDASDEAMVKEETLNAVISEKILDQELKNKGIEPSSSKLDETIEQVKANFENEEKYLAYIEQMELTEEEFKEQIAYDLKIQSYMDTELPDSEVSDEEIEQYYEQLSAQSEDVPKLSEIKAQLKQKITTQKKSTQLSKKINELKKEAEIEKLI